MNDPPSLSFPLHFLVGYEHKNHVTQRTLITQGFAPPSGIITPPSVWNTDCCCCCCCFDCDAVAFGCFCCCVCLPSAAGISVSKSEKSLSSFRSAEAENSIVEYVPSLRRDCSWCCCCCCCCWPICSREGYLAVDVFFVG